MDVSTKMKLIFAKKKNSKYLKVNLGVNPEYLVALIFYRDGVYCLKDFYIKKRLNQFEDKVKDKIRVFLDELNSEKAKISPFVFKHKTIHKELFL